MDPKERRSRSPSLLDADAHEPASIAHSERILSGFPGDTGASAAPARPRHGLWLAALLVVGVAALSLLVLGGAFDHAASSSRTSSGNSTDAAPAPSTAGASATADANLPPASQPTEGDAPSGTAVILPDRADTRTANATLPAPAASISKDSVALGDMFSPPQERKRTTPVHRAKRTTTVESDSDVALLTALLNHVEAGGPGSRKALGSLGGLQKPLDPIEVRMQACPAANTEAGLKCRQKLCAGHSGLVAACPASATDTH